MRKNNPWFSFESDNDEIDLEQDVLGTDTVLDENAVDDAGDDSETVPVKPDTKKTAHNELASAGGVATSNNVDQLEVDPVVATESFMYKFLGLSREDLDETVDEITEKAETIPDADEPVSVTGDDDMDSVIITEEESGGEVVDADDTGVDNPALDDEVVDTSDDDSMEWYRSLEEEVPSGCTPTKGQANQESQTDGDQSENGEKTDESDESNEFWKW